MSSDFPLSRWLAGGVAGAAALLAARTRRRRALRTAASRLRAVERELALAQQQQRELLDSLGIVVFQTDADGRWTYLSEAWRRITGYSVARSIGRAMSDYLAPEARAAAREHLALYLRAREHATAVPIRLTLVRRGGGQRVVELRSSQLTPAEARVEGLAGTLTDVTVQVEIEQRLARQRRLYRLLAENDSDLTCVLDSELRFTYVSPSSATLLGYLPEELMAASRLPVHDDDAATAAAQAEAALGGAERTCTMRLRHRDGRWLIFECTAAPLRESDGRGAGISVTARDVTARVQAEEARRRSERMASLGRMLAGAAHELNNPLAAISGFAQILLREPLPDESRSALETIEHEARRAAAIVRELLTFSRPDAAGEGELRRVDLNRVARYIAGTRRFAIEQMGITLVLETADGTLEVLGGNAKLEQVVLNLLVNAEQSLESLAEARERGGNRDGVAPRIVVRTRRLGGLALLEVEDNGPGIPLEQLPLIWDPFWTTKQSREGTGLGLPVVHEIISAHGGSVDVRSEPDVVTCFRIVLPCAPEDANAQAELPPHDRTTPLDILLIGDDGTARPWVQHLAERGHAVLVASDVMQGLRYAEREGPNVVIMDAGKCEGHYDIAARLRALPTCKATRIVILGASDATASDDHLVVHIGLPIAVDALRSAVEGEG